MVKKKIQEKICDALENKPHEFFVPYTRTITGVAVIFAMNMEEAQDKLAANDYDVDEDTINDDWDFEAIEDSDEI